MKTLKTNLSVLMLFWVSFVSFGQGPGADEAQISYEVTNNLSGENDYVTVAFNLEYLDDNKYYDHLSYMEVDVKFDDNPNYEGLVYVRHNSLNTNSNPYTDYETIDKSNNNFSFMKEEKYWIRFNNVRNGNATDGIGVTYEVKRKTESNTTPHHRLYIKIPVHKLNKTRDKGKITIRVRGAMYDRSSTSTSTDAVNENYNEFIIDEELSTNGKSHLNYSVKEFANQGFNRIKLRLEKYSNEGNYDHLGCLDIGKLTFDANGKQLSDVIFARLGHTYAGLKCGEVSNPKQKIEFVGNNGDTYRFTGVGDLKLLETSGKRWTKDANGDVITYIDDYFPNNEKGVTIKYYVAGTYIARSIGKSTKQKIIWYQNLSSGTNLSNHFSPPAIDLTSATVSSTDNCTIELNWTNHAGYGDSNRNYVNLYRDNNFLATFKVSDNITTYKDTNVVAGEKYNYQISNVYQRDHGDHLHGQKSTAKSAQIDLLDAPSGLASQQSGCDGNIELTWNYTTNPAKFVLQRKTATSDFVTVADNINGALRAFTDTKVVKNEVYYYRIAAVAGVDKCSSIGVYSPTLTHSKDAQDITGIFDNNSYKVEASKGYYDDRTELEWTPNLDFEQYVHQYKIYTRELGSLIKPKLLETLDINAKTFKDVNGSAGTIYEYFIVAERVVETTCGRQITASYPIDALTNTKTPQSFPKGVGYDVGLRVASGVINGNITYKGGTAVPNVKVVAERQDASNGQSIYFNGSSSYAVINADKTLTPKEEITLSAWVKPENLNKFSVILEKQFSYGFHVSADGSIYFYIKDQASNEHQAKSPNGVIKVGQWQNITGVYNQATRKLGMYVNGKKVAEKTLPNTVTSMHAGNKNYPLTIGKQHGTESHYYQGYVDEVKLFHRALPDNEVTRESGKFTATDAKDLKMYLKIFAGAGNKIYDLAHEADLYYKNNGYLTNVEFSNDAPTETQLGNAGYTDRFGNYTIYAVEYRGNGENFNIIPTATLAGAVHKFNPSRKTIFVGEGNKVINGQDFEDISSFRFSGYVRFDFEDTVGGRTKTSGASGIRIYLDGGSALTTSDNQVFETGEDGFFDVQVPIGNHFLEFRKNKHTFTNGRFPETGTYDFQQEVTGVQIQDVTLHILSGKVVGGVVEANKPLFRDYNPSSNNIGQAKFTLTSEDGKIVREVTTNAKTGEFSIKLPPKKYTSSAVKWVKDNANIFESANIKPIDLSSVFAYNGTQEKDSIFNQNKKFERIDSIFYNLRKDFIYRTLPQLVVTDTTGANIKKSGEERYMLDQGNKKIAINLTSLKFPTYRSSSNYALKIKAVEKYTNKDSNQQTTVPVSDGKITVNNGIGFGYYIENKKKKAYGVPEKINLDKNGELVYLFKANEPNINENKSAGKEHLSYTQQLSMTLNVGDVATFWPNPSNQNETQRAYVFGGKQEGANFVTKAPPVVDFVLRDPPGSNSYAFLSKEQSISSTTEYSSGRSADISASIGLGIGMNTLVGGGIVGVGEVAEGKIVGTLGFRVNADREEGGAVSYETSFTETIQTNAEPIQVGRSDIFVAKSQNMMTGTGVHIRPVPIELCGGNCYGDIMTDATGKKYRMTRVLQSYLNPVGTPTFLIFSQNHIENVLIPDLVEVRNSFLTKAGSKYVSKIPVDHPNFGTNNDDKVWGTAATTKNSIKTELADFDGSSYKYTPKGDVTKAIDSIRAINQQIRLWKEALANNEIQKWMAKKYRNAENVSLASGVTLTRESAKSYSKTTYTTLEIQTSVSVGAKIEFDGYGVAIDTEINTEIGFRSSQTESSERTNTRTVGYVLNDPDEDDSLSIDIYDGEGDNGPIFLTKAGQTSCPFEDKIIMKYATREYIETLIAINQGEKNKAEEEAKAFGIAGATSEEAKKYGKVNQINADINQLKLLLSELKSGEVILSNKTLQRDKPKIKINGAKTAQAFNVPANEAANFNLSLINAGEAGDPQYFAVEALDETNPNGLEMTIDGQSINSSRKYLVQGRGGIEKILKVRRGPNHYSYRNIGVVIKSTCQADPTGNDAVLADTIHFNVKYLPVCTNLKINSPSNNWTVNNSFNNKLPIAIGDYDVNTVGFEEISIQYKPSNSSDWILLTTYYRNEEVRKAKGGAKEAPVLPTNGNSFTYQWDLGKLPDGDYDIRAVSKCALAENVTEIYSGKIDRTNPTPFGLPQPSDGILSPGEQPSVQFNETINENLLSPANFDVRGVLNGGKIRHSSSVAFAGAGTSYVEVEAIDIVDKPFSIDFYAKRDKNNAEQILVAQGTKQGEELVIGFNAANQIYFTLGGKTVTGTTAINNKWHHYAFTYDPLKSDLTIYYDAKLEKIDNSFTVDAKLTGKMLFGKSPRVNANFFTGNMHEVRVWSKPLTIGQINIYAVKRLVGNEAGLLHNWQMEEANGVLALDKAKGKHAKMNATWAVSPKGYALKLNGTADQANATPVAFDNTSDYTVEFWFKSNGGTDQVLLSNGKGDGVDANKSGWSIGIDTDGTPYAQSNGEKIKGKSVVNNNQWHHIALAANARGNTTLFVNAKEVGKINTDKLKGFSGSALWIGQQGWFEGTVKKTAKYFTGSIDELRIWNAFVRSEQLSRDRFNMLSGNEPGLVRYYPFETYTDNSGVVSVSSTLNNMVTNAKPVEAITLTGTAVTNQDTPTIKLKRPVEFVNFSYVVNNDKVIVTLNVEPSKIENVRLDFTMKGVKDLNGNSIVSPVKWSAFVDRNQVIWQDNNFVLETDYQKELVFETQVVNNSGESKIFNISNIPNWLEVTPSSGTVGPLTTLPIKFRVSENVNIGNYNEDILLSTTDFGFAEKLNVNVGVKKALPKDWKINPDSFEYSMNIIGQVAINNVISRDSGNILGVFVNDECRGMAKLKYVEAYDNYQAFLTIYSNVATGEEMEFRVWEHQDGIVHSSLDHKLPSNKFTADTYHGTAKTPELFSTTNVILSTINVVDGWKWIAFNLNGTDLSSPNTLMKNLNPSDGNIIKTRVNVPNGKGGFNQRSLFDTYSESTETWAGSLSTFGKLSPAVLYKLKTSALGKIVYQGLASNPLTTDINITSGWNYIGYLGLHNIPVNEALSNFNAAPGDLIKNQYYSAIYDANNGWVGTLKVLKPNEGYMLRAKNTQKFKYPSFNSTARTSKFGGITKIENVKANVSWSISAKDYENNMSVIAVINHDELGTQNGVLGAFVNGVCKGYAAPLFNKELNKNVYFLNIGNQNGKDTITYKYLDNENHVIYNIAETTTYGIDAVEGDLSSPKVLSLVKGELLGGVEVSVYPNPANETLYVSIPLQEVSTLSLALFDTNGRQIFVRKPETLLKGKHKFSINTAKLASGIYHLKINLNDKVFDKKIVVSK